MKRIALSLAFMVSGIIINAQVPQGFNYQAVAHNSAGAPIMNTTIQVKMGILSDTITPVLVWEELHSAVKTNIYGMFNLVIGTGVRQSGSAQNFSDIDWTNAALFLKIQINYQGAWKNMGSAKLWSVPYAMVTNDIGAPLKKLTVTGETDNLEEALFEVKNKDGQTIFAVYNEGVRVYVSDGDAKGVKGGFAIGGFGTVKQDEPQHYLFVSGDSIRAYIDSTSTKAVKGGFAIGGFGTVKSPGEEYLRVTRDSTRIYLNNTETKGAKGGFAIGGFGTAKDAGNEYLSVTMDSVKVSKSLLIPRLTTEERDNLPFTPGEALIIFNTTEGCMQIFKKSVWSNIWCFNCAPDFIIQPVDKTICSGENAIFFASATGTSLSYQWQESNDNGNSWYNIYNGGSNPAYTGCNGYTLSLTNIPVSYHSFKYRCVVAGSCLPNVISNAVTLNVGSTPPVIYSQTTDQQLSPGCTANFSIISPGYSVSYQWQQSSDGANTWTNISDGGTGPVFSGSTTSTIFLSNVPWTCNNYKYRCIVSNLCGADTTSTAATLTIAPSSIATQPSDQQLTTGCDASFSITSPEGYVVSYQWQASGDDGDTWGNISDGGIGPVYSGVTASTLSLSSVPLTYNNYQYRCTVSSLCGPNEASNAATLTIASSSIVTQPSDQQLSTGCDASFSITSPAGYVVSYQWQASVDDGDTWSNISDGGTSPVNSGVTASSLALSNVPLANNNFKYRCIVSSLCGPNETSNSATLTVDASPVITVQPVNRLVYNGGNIDFSITTSGSGFNYQWQVSTNGGGTWLNIADGGSNPAYTGANTPGLSLTNVPLAFNNYKYRCVVSHYCRPDAITDAVTLSVPTPVPVTDSDGNAYNTVGIGTQLWMAENLKTTRYNNGDLIGTTIPATLDILSEDIPKYQWAYNGNESNVEIYGRLYTWYAVTDSRNVCPIGWHVPNDTEWWTLINFLGQDNAGSKLKEAGTTHWAPPPSGATNETGFTALPGGYRQPGGGFILIGLEGYLYSSTEVRVSYAYSWVMYSYLTYVANADFSKPNGMAVRCVKD